MRQSQTSETMLTARQVADFLQVHISTVRRWSDQGILRSYRVGPRGDYRFLLDEVVPHLLGEPQGGNGST